MNDTPITDKAFRSFSAANLERVYTMRNLRVLEETVKGIERELNRAVAFIARLKRTSCDGRVVAAFSEADVEEMKHIVEGESK